jgi:hypothetical protein
LKIPYRHVAAAAAVLAFAGAGTALAHGGGHGNNHTFGTTGTSGPTGATGATGATGPAGSHGKHHGRHKKHKVAWIFRGTFNSADSSVTVTAGNSRVRKGGFVGQTVKFDLTDARIQVDDTNNDGDETLADVKDGDEVLVHARLPKDGSATQPFKAKKLIDLTNLPSDDEGDDNGQHTNAKNHAHDD